MQDLGYIALHRNFMSAVWAGQSNLNNQLKSIQTVHIAVSRYHIQQYRTIEITIWKVLLKHLIQSV